MTDSAMNASPADSPAPDNTIPRNILERMEAYKEQHPTAFEYWIEDEIEAAQLLVAMAATLDTLINDVNYDKIGSDHLKEYSRTYKSTVRQGKAISYLRNLADTDAIAIHGMRIMARRIIIN